MRRWKRVETADGPRFRCTLDPHEAALIGNLTGSLVDMLNARESATPADELHQITGIRTGHASPPEDDTMRRLLPDFHRPDGDGSDPPNNSLNSALRSLHEPAIIDAKRDAAQRVLNSIPEGGGRLELSAADADAWIAAVNDIRLALGTMLRIGPEGPERLAPEHPLAAHLDVYQWLTVLQEYLVLALIGRR